MIKRVAVLGAGRYGEVLLKEMTSAEEQARGIEVVATHRRADRRAELQEKYGIPVLADNQEACRDADMIYPVVRPEQMADLLTEIGPSVQDHQILATGAAALALPFYRQFLPSKCALAWVFPTFFITIRAGFLAIHPEPGIDIDKLAALKEYWSRFCDEVLILGEEVLDTFTILHACGPFFLFPVIKAMIHFGELGGFSREVAQRIVLNTLKATAQRLSDIECSPERLDRLMADVSVPGSLTGAGLGVMKEKDVEGTFAQVEGAALKQAERKRGG